MVQLTAQRAAIIFASDFTRKKDLIKKKDAVLLKHEFSNNRFQTNRADILL